MTLRVSAAPAQAGPEEITALRTLYEYLTNQALERAGVEQRIDITKRVDGPLPQPRLGRVDTAEERRAAIADGIDVKNMSAAELVCAHEPVTHAGRDGRAGRPALPSVPHRKAPGQIGQS